MARYDYGMRGFRETTSRLERGGFRSHPSRPQADERRDPRARTPRVTAGDNRDYVVGARGPTYPRHDSPYGGDPRVRLVDEYGYRRPYTTIGGSRPRRGVVRGQAGSRYDRLYSDYDRVRDY